MISLRFFLLCLVQYHVLLQMQFCIAVNLFFNRMLRISQRAAQLGSSGEPVPADFVGVANRLIIKNVTNGRRLIKLVESAVSLVQY